MICTEPQVALSARLTSGQAAKILKVSRSSIHNYVNGGLLKATLTENGRFRISGKNLIEFWKRK
ncbi:MAG: helix-turn-helix domain-containing protein [Bacteroidales bacterium]|nr:helix-turn-helix domain-containing protein [Bacteroidales bacterium]